jgi:hypothetical protein
LSNYHGGTVKKVDALAMKQIFMRLPHKPDRLNAATG